MPTAHRRKSRSIRFENLEQRRLLTLSPESFFSFPAVNGNSEICSSEFKAGENSSKTTFSPQYLAAADFSSLDSEPEGESEALVQFSYKFVSLTGQSLDPDPNDGIEQYRATVGDTIKLQVYARDLRSLPKGVFSTGQNIVFDHQDDSPAEILGLWYSESIDLLVTNTPVNATATYRIQFGDGAGAVTTQAIQHPRADGVVNNADSLRIANAINAALDATLPGDSGATVTYRGLSNGYLRFNISFANVSAFRFDVPNASIVENNIVSSGGGETVVATSYDPNPQSPESIRTALVPNDVYQVLTQPTTWDFMSDRVVLAEASNMLQNGIFVHPTPAATTLQYEVLLEVVRTGTVFVSSTFADPYLVPVGLLGFDNAIPASQIIFPQNIPLQAIDAGSDRFENNNTRTTAKSFGNLQGVLSENMLSIHNAADEDWYSFTTLATGNSTNFVGIDFSHASGDLDLELYNQAGEKIGNSSSTSNEETISLQGLAAGTYYARVLGFNGATNANYYLFIDAPYSTIPADTAEPNNTTATARNIGAITEITSIGYFTIHTTNDVDYFRFETLAAGKSGDHAQINFAHDAGDLELRLLNASGLQLASSATANSFERISLENRPAGVYYVQVLGENGSRSPSYSLTIDPPALSISPDYLEPNDSFAAATELSINQAFTSFSSLSIHQSGNEDWHFFQLVQEGTSSHYISIDFEHRNGDVDLQLLDENGTVLRSSTTAQNQERISLAGLGTGTYFIRIFGNANATQPDYRLNLSLPIGTIYPDEYETNETLATAYNLRALSGSVAIENLNIHQSTDRDWFRFETTATGNSSHFIGLLYLSGGTDIDLELYDQNGVLLQRSSVNDNWEIINFANRPAGTYYARIYPATSGTNSDYSLGFALPQGNLSADRFEINNSLNTSTDLKKLAEPTEFTSLTIHDGSDVDWYRFETVAAGTENHYVELSSSTAAGNIEAELYDVNGVLLERTNGLDVLERLSLRGRPVGSYYVRILGINSATSLYSLDFEVPTVTIPLDDYEANNQRTSAFNLRGVEGKLRLDDCTIHANDQDWFRFELLNNASTSHYVLADFRQTQGDIDLELYDSQGTLIRSSAGSSAPETISLAGLLPGTYFIRLFGYQNATNPNYSLEIVAPSSGDLNPDRYESNNDLATATSIRSSGNTLAGAVDIADVNIHSAADKDFYRFTTVANATAAHSISVDFNTGDGDLDLFLLDNDGNILRQSTQTNQTEHISLAGLAAATYVVRVQGKAGVTNNYRLRFDTPEASGKLDSWTIMVYITASDLDPYAYDDINELEIAARSLPGNVNLAVLWDQSSRRSTYATGHGSQPAWGTAGRSFIQSDSNRQSVATSFELLPEQNTGNAATLNTFIDWAVATAPAEKYALIAWDHGAGIYGSNYDNSDNASSDHLEISELIAALSPTDVPQLQILSFDACLMAMTEVAHATRSIGDILVSSQEVVGAEGYDYTTLFASLVRNPRATAAELAAGMVNSYQTSYSADANGWNTQSAIALNWIDPLTSALASFTSAATSLTTTQWQSLSNNFQAAIGYADPDFRDLGSAMSAIVDNATLPTALKQAASQVLTSLSGSVLSLATDSRNSSGLSIFVPDSTSQVTSFAQQFAEFSAATGWASFLTQLVSQGGGGGGSGGRFGRSVSIRDWAENNDRFATATNLFQLSGTNVSYSSLSLHDSDDVDWFRFQLGSAGTSTHKVQLNKTSSEAVKLEIYNATGLTKLRESNTASNPVLSLDGLAQGEYHLRILSPTGLSVAGYSILFDAPTASMVDRTGANTTLGRAFPLGLVTERLSVPGLEIAAQGQEWFTFSTPKLPNAQWYSVEIALGNNVQAEAFLRDQAGNVVSTATGAGTLLLSYRAGGSGETYSLQVVSQASVSGTFSILMGSLTATFPDVTVTANLGGTVIDQLPLTELVGSVGTVQLSDNRFMWQNNQLLLKPGTYFDTEDQRVTQLRINVTDASEPNRSVSFILPIRILSNPSPWHNSESRWNANLDRDNTGKPIINAIDALVIINHLNRFGNGEAPAFREASPTKTEFQFDVDDSGFFNAMDALIIINYLAVFGPSGEQGEGEGEAVASAVDLESDHSVYGPENAGLSYSSVEMSLIDLLAEDPLRRRRRFV
jgi:hypothetical protein